VRDIILDPLSPGLHTIYLFARDSRGLGGIESILLNVVARDNEPTLLILLPRAFQQSTGEFLCIGGDCKASGHIMVIVHFSKPVDVNSVVPQQTVILSTPLIPNEDVNILWNSERTSMQVTSVDPGRQL
jgi:hypothetical protein